MFGVARDAQLPGGSAEGAAPDVVPVRHPLRTATSAVLLVAVALVGFAVARNPNFEWRTVGHYLFDPRILRGLRTTLILTAISMVVASSIGLLLAIMRVSTSRFLSAVSQAYLWAFRGTPLLVQLLFWFNFSALFAKVSIGVPFGPTFASFGANSLITPWVAATLGLGLNEAAYMAEIFRAGLLSVDRGQHEAAKALGMRDRLALRRIVLPQALRVIVPPWGNETINMLKYTSLVSVIALSDLLYSGQLIYAQTFETIPVLIVVSVWYLGLVSVLTVGQAWLERRVGAGYASDAGRTRRPRWRR